MYTLSARTQKPLGEIVNGAPVSGRSVALCVAVTFAIVAAVATPAAEAPPDANRKLRDVVIEALRFECHAPWRAEVPAHADAEQEAVRVGVAVRHVRLQVRVV